MPIHNSITSIVSIYTWFAFACFGSLIFFLACKESASVDTQGLNGRWEIYKASRNGQETPYLRRGYFIFDPQGSLTVNITGKDERNPFVIDGNIITINENTEYTITSLRNDSMDIHYVMNPESEFMFFLKKTLNEKH